MDNHTTEICYIYGLRDKNDTRYFYVGSTKKLPAQRLREHLDYIRLGYNKNRHLVHKVKKVGVENIAIDTLETCTGDNRFELEYLWLEKLTADAHPLTNIVKAPYLLEAQAKTDEFELTLWHVEEILSAYLFGCPRNGDTLHDMWCQACEDYSRHLIDNHFEAFSDEIQLLLARVE